MPSWAWLCSSTESDLSGQQLPAFHIFWYDAEVQNGGHLQYFLNRGGDEAAKAVGSLRALGALGHADLLERALTLWQSDQRAPPRWRWQYVRRAREGRLSAMDQNYHELSPSLMEVLQAHLNENQEKFVVVVT